MALSLMKGGTFAIPGKVADKSAQPVFHFSPGSYNSQKGKLLLLISSLDSSDINFNSIVYPEENQTLEYATNLSPNMSVPALEIDGNIVINDSYDIHKYLLENYPGKGNSSLTAEMKVVQEDFIAINLKWDEYLFSYRKIPKVMGAAMHQIRLVELSNAIRQAESDGLMDKKLMDGRTVRQVYIEKVAQIRSLIRIGCDSDNLEQLEARIKANDERMEDILKSANRLLDSHKLLLTEDQMTSADVYLAVLIARISMVDGNLLKQKFADFPAIEKWWNRITALEVSECLKVGTSTKVKMLLGKSPKILLSALGLLNPHPLPEDMEKEVNNKLEEIMTAYYKP